MSRFHRRQLGALAAEPPVGSIVGSVLKLLGEQPLVDISHDHLPREGSIGSPRSEQLNLGLRSDHEFAEAKREIKKSIIGNEESLDALMDQIRDAVQLRESSTMEAHMSPLGVFALVGTSGLGKKSLAEKIGFRLYAGDQSVRTLDVSVSASRGELRSHARLHPFTTFVLDNFERCHCELREEILSIVSGVTRVHPETGGTVSFRHCFFFLLIHQSAESIPLQVRPPVGTGSTIVLRRLQGLMEIDEKLGWSLQGIYPFVLPPALQQARVVALLLQRKCENHNRKLVRVDPAILAREASEVSVRGSFDIVPERVNKLLQMPLLAAISENRPQVDMNLPVVPNPKLTKLKPEI